MIWIIFSTLIAVLVMLYFIDREVSKIEKKVTSLKKSIDELVNEVEKWIKK